MKAAQQLNVLQNQNTCSLLVQRQNDIYHTRGPYIAQKYTDFPEERFVTSVTKQKM